MPKAFLRKRLVHKASLQTSPLEWDSLRMGLLVYLSRFWQFHLHLYQKTKWTTRLLLWVPQLIATVYHKKRLTSTHQTLETTKGRTHKVECERSVGSLESLADRTFRFHEGQQHSLCRFRDRGWNWPVLCDNLGCGNLCIYNVMTTCVVTTCNIYRVYEHNLCGIRKCSKLVVIV